MHERVPRATDAGWWLGGLEAARTGGAGSRPLLLRRSSWPATGSSMDGELEQLCGGEIRINRVMRPGAMRIDFNPQAEKRYFRHASVTHPSRIRHVSVTHDPRFLRFLRFFRFYFNPSTCPPTHVSSSRLSEWLSSVMRDR